MRFIGTGNARNANRLRRAFVSARVRVKDNEQIAEQD
jgi:hypothetical protein